MDAFFVDAVAVVATPVAPEAGTGVSLVVMTWVITETDPPARVVDDMVVNVTGVGVGVIMELSPGVHGP